MKSLKDIAYNRIFKSDATKSFAGYYNPDISVTHIFAERSTCSIIAGIDETIKKIIEYFKDSGEDYVLIEAGCKGFCKYDPVISIQVPGRALLSFKNVFYNNINTILDSILNNILPDKSCIIGQIAHPQLNLWPEVPQLFDLDFFRHQNRKLMQNSGFVSAVSIESYFDYDGYKAFGKIITTNTPVEVCNIIENSELRGRGGGGFFTGKKWKKALENNSSKKYFICNADESDPGSFAGRGLIESNPHLLIEGILIGAYAINADEAIIYIRNTYSLAIERINQAIAQATKAGFIGEDIFGSGIDIKLKVFAGPGAYVCGEETALISSLEGKRGMPKTKPPYPSESGLFGYPTVVNNAETICNIPIIINQTPEVFKQSGNKNSYGTKLFSVSGKVDLPGIVEMEMGISPNDILSFTKLDDNQNPIKAIHLGGPSGGFIQKQDFGLSLDFNSINNSGLWFGSGSFVVLDDTNCVVDITKYYIDFAVNESCGKCIPCREGSQRLLEILKRITERPKTSLRHETLLRFKGVMQMEEISALMKETSLCGLGQNAPNSVLSGLKFFRQEYEEHIYEKKCEANVCRNLKEYTVNVDNCVGCSICAKRCPTDAIIGSPRAAHFIIQDRCIKCGICENACKFDAINVN